MSDFPKQIGRYEILAELGRGDLSVVYKARDPLINRMVAIKMLQAVPDSRDELDAWKATFRREVEASGKLDHPHIVRLLDAGAEAENLYVVMEYIDGEPLSTLNEGDRLSLSHKVDVALQISDALSYSHAQGVVHAAVKPTNVLLTRDGQVKITDFGISRLALPLGGSTPLPIRPRPHYRSPEQVFGRRADERSDIFSLGVVLYEMLFKRRPFEGDSYIRVTQQILNAEPSLLTMSGQALPEPLARVLRHALAKNPIDRYQSAREIHRDLVVVADDVDSSASLPAVDGQGVAVTTPGEQAARLVIEEDGRHRVVPLSKAVTSVGRRSDNDLVLADEHISRRHARIMRQEDDFVIEDLTSRHGTFLNGERITRAVLKGGDRVQIGKSRRFRITFHTSEDIGITTTWGAEPSPLPQRSLNRNLELLLDVSRALSSSLSVDDVLNIIMDAALEFTEAERGFLMLREAEGGFRTRIARAISERGPDTDASGVSTTIVDRCIASGKPVAIHNIDESDDLSPTESMLKLNLKYVLAVPLIYKGEVMGVLYLDSRRIGHPLGPEQLELLVAFAGQASVSLENARLYELATIDPLTRLPHKGHFDTRLAEEFQRAARRNRPLSLLFLDLDRFKLLNDTHGHLMGDEVLREVASVLPRLGRISDLAARYGGEEFVLLAPETRLEDAAVLGDRIREEIRAIRFESNGERFGVTVSIGASTLDVASMDTPDALIDAADKAMYKAKNLGGDRVCLAHGPAPRES